MLRRIMIALAAGSAVVLSGAAMAERPNTGIWAKTPRIKRKPKVQQEQPSPPVAPLQGLTTGLNVQNSAGAPVGTVSQVVTASDGSLQSVIITGLDGKSYSLLATQLSIANGVVVTR